MRPCPMPNTIPGSGGFDTDGYQVIALARAKRSRRHHRSPVRAPNMRTSAVASTATTPTTTRIGAIRKGENPPPDAVIMPPTTPITVDPKTKSTATTASTAKTARDAMFGAGARPLARRSRT